MGLFQRAYETFETHQDLVGIYRENESPLCPIGHKLAALNIVITINEKGEFKSARSVSKDEGKVIIPVTEESMGRTSGLAAHPLCDQIGYVASYNEDKHQLYTELLEQWAKSDYTSPKLTAVLTYVKSNTILQDLNSFEILKLNEKGLPEDDKVMIGWDVVGLGLESGPVYRDRNLFNLYRDFYESRQSGEKKLCMISGTYDYPAKQHLKGIFSFNGNAKLISANDTSNFTYRGRFLEDEQALTVGYVASQKVHNALQWVIENQGTVFGGRVFICWIPTGQVMKLNLANPLLKQAEEKIVPSDYKKVLQNTVFNIKQNNSLKGDEPVVLAAFDAATSGRLSVTYYNEYSVDRLLERIQTWDELCSWSDSYHGTYAPSLFDIVKCAMGIQRTEKGKENLVVSDDLLRNTLQRLIWARMDGGHVPYDIIKQITARANSPQMYSEAFLYQRVLFTACAVLRKHYSDTKGVLYDMALEKHKKDRSYQYGRLLAILEAAENSYHRGQNSGVKETNASRMQTVFSQRPQYAARIILEKVKTAYLPRLSAASQIFYERMIAEVYEELSEYSDEELKKSLDDSYLMGYYLQKNDIYSSHKNEEDSKE